MSIMFLHLISGFPYLRVTGQQRFLIITFNTEKVVVEQYWSTCFC